MSTAQRKFQPGDRFVGKPDGVKAWIRDEPGVVLDYHAVTGEYHVRLDNGDETYVRANWIDHGSIQRSGADEHVATNN